MAPELKLTKKVTADKQERDLPLPIIVFERAPEAEPRRFYVLYALASHGTATKPRKDEFECESERSLTEP